MTIWGTARLVLLSLALVALAGAETVWSLALSTAHDPACDPRGAAIADSR
jgi:hypothetical protein